ncbi:MAG: biotin--[acetyl-CoA-carboxylase] ligase [Lachnospiraceae bacterium]|nr:biotin--[acetyl-CoA-carboxylase] ligase [Lachnospiraceae bacterium]
MESGLETVIEEKLNSAGLDIRVVYKDETGSTNEDAIKLLKGSDRPVLVIADKQNKGRGRRGRDFYSPAGTGLYMSLAFGNALSLIRNVKVTAVAAVSVAEAIDKVVYGGHDHSLIKWVNDIYVDDKKVCGILTEAMLPGPSASGNGGSEAGPDAGTGPGGAMVVGIGINVYEPPGDFPDDIKGKAGYLIGRGEVSAGQDGGADRPGRSDIRLDLAAEVIRNFFHYIKEPKESLRIYRDRSYLIGKHVMVNSFVPGDRRSGLGALVTGIDDDCRLLIEYEDGTSEALSSGEVSVVLG